MPRPRKPYLRHEKSRHGTWVWYFKRGSGPRVRIRAPFGTPEFNAEYDAALAGQPLNPPAVRQPRQPRHAAGRSKVYLIGSAAWVKIGFTTRSPSVRLAEFKTGVPVDVKVLKVFEGDKSLEIELHHRFAHLREAGEWFRRSGSLAAWIADGCPLDRVPEAEDRAEIIL